ncbi:DUF4383 domain-containing protein [Micromonospora echinofusca]|uniref:DUF4383 domain-containing protein n=1 Tax=Micromonospora echinofusca TaxID=47858 RepID=A0ABS3VXA7_MICEH|nr:DUF4383 domain-containing protein [Micromonospora echinofusca]MBO4209167.1 DUF4383 domain-containing protein [Micromonospora echinofusca]
MTREVTGRRRSRPGRVGSRIQRAAAIVAATFVLVGLLGFVPGVTTGYGDLSFAGHGSGAKLLGVFQVSVLHNVVHLLFGLAGLVLSRSVVGSRIYLAGGGAVYLALWLYGLVIDHASAANFIPVNGADNWLHLGLGLGMLILGLLLSPRANADARQLDNPAP